MSKVFNLTMRGFFLHYVHSWYENLQINKAPFISSMNAAGLIFK